MKAETQDQTGLVFNFWKDNRLDAHYTFTIGDIVAKWDAWYDYQINVNPERGQKWYEYYYGAQAVRCFIGDKENILGLQSVSEQEQFDSMYELLRKHFK